MLTVAENRELGRVRAAPPAIARRLAAERGMPSERAERTVNEMLKFLSACALSDEPLVPSPDVDDAWHAFILDTEAYQDYCESAFGQLIHHTPGFDGDVETAYRRTRELIAGRFGLDAELWPAAGADCGRCHGP